jgi:hypothetical protein
MSQEPQKPKPKHGHYERPVSLYGMTFDQAVTKLAKAKPVPKPKKKPAPKS